MTRILDFRTPIVFEWGSFSRLNSYIPEGRTFLVLGRGSARDLDIEKRVRSMIDGELQVFKGVEPNPSSKTVERGGKMISEFEPDLVLAVGGGSVMDAAKFMSVIGRHGRNAYDYATGGVTPPDGGYPVYAVPTTPGTSSEITPFAVVSLEEMENKVGFRNPAIYPAGAIIDPWLTLSLPRDQTVATGFDILSHAVESFWSVHSDPLTRELSARSVSLVERHLPGAVEDGSSRVHREGMSLASVLAGLSFSNTGTTICHSISYPITYDSGLHHGLAVALTLGPTFDKLREKGFDGLSPLAEALGTNEEGFSDKLIRLMESVGAPTRMSKTSFNGDVERIMSTDMSPLMRNMPVEMNEDDVREIIRRAA